MSSRTVFRNAYTDVPEQHPNLILGSLQLLFWLFFYRSAWRQHLSQIEPAFNPGVRSWSRLRWQNPALQKLLLQGYLVLPLLVNLPLSFVLWALGESQKKAELQMLVALAEAVAFSAAGTLTLTVAEAVAEVVAVIVALIIASTVVSPVQETVVGFVAEANVFIVALTVSLPVAILTAAGEEQGTRKFVPFFVTEAVAFLIALLLVEDINVTAVKPVAFLVAVVAAIFIALLVAALVIVIFSADLAFLVVFLVVIAVAKGMALFVAFMMAVTLGFILKWLKPLTLYPFSLVWNSLLYNLDTRLAANKPSLLRWHSGFWDESQYLPLVSLDKHLVLVMERNPAEGQRAINFLITSHQRWAVREAQIELDARNLERCTDIKAISKAHHQLAVGELEDPISPLRSFSSISKNVDAALNQKSAYNQRQALTTIADSLNGLLRELNRSKNKFASRFPSIAISWHQIVSDYVRELAEVVERQQEIDNPYIIGVPLTGQEKIFVKPADISGTDISLRIEQLLQDRRRPPLLLYGQRRMGKTSLLNNLGRLLPNSIIPMFVDLQGPVTAARDHAGFLYNLARLMVNSAKRDRDLIVPDLTREALATDPFTGFDKWLNDVEQALEDNTALLALDEFEKLDSAISKGRFDEDRVLGMLRHLIQHRPRFKVLLAGSHTIEEFQRWASYLINVQVVHISYLKEEEARKLIEQPIPDFTLRYEPHAVQRVLQLTRCHPNLVQLLCNEIVVLKNEQDPSIRRMATLSDVEAAVPKALEHGILFFADIQNNQVDADGLKLLRFLAAQGEGATVSKKALSRQFCDLIDSTLNLLLRRELIEQVEDGYCFQVELIRRWFVKSR